MGTRGIYGFKLDGQYKITYNHSDSYPTGLGREILNFIIHFYPEVEKLKEKVRNVKLVYESQPAPKELQEKYKRHANTNVSTQRLSDWYCLLYETRFGKILYDIYDCDVEHMIDSYEFVLDSLFCEWGYIINLDVETLEIYKGFQKKPQKNNPFGQQSMKTSRPTDNKYYPIKLMISTSLEVIARRKAWF